MTHLEIKGHDVRGDGSFRFLLGWHHPGLGEYHESEFRERNRSYFEAAVKRNLMRENALRSGKAKNLAEKLNAYEKALSDLREALSDDDFGPDRYEFEKMAGRVG